MSNISRAAIYCRQSILKEDSCSIDVQVKRCTALCESRGWEFEVFIDEGFSGKDMERPNFQKMLESLENFNYVVVYKIDRISRNLRDFTNLVEIFQSKNIGFHSITENFDTTTPMGRAMMAMIAVFAQLERETIVERVKDNMLGRARMGIWNGGPVPYGFTASKCTIDGKQRSVLVPCEEEQEEVKKMFEYYISPNGSIRSLTRKLNALKIPTKTGKTWNPNQVSRILRNPLYCIADETAYEYFSQQEMEIACAREDFGGTRGLMYYNRRKPHKKTTRERNKSEWILSVGHHEGIIPGEVFVCVQEKLKKSRDTHFYPAKSSKALLAFLLKCEKCGGAMTYKDYKKSDWQYYTCHKGHYAGACEGQTVKARAIEDAVIHTIKKVCSDEKFLKQIAADAAKKCKADLAPLEKQRKKILASLNEMTGEQKELIKALGRKKLPVEIVEERIKEIEELKKPLQEELQEIENKINKAALQDIDLDQVFGNLCKFNDVFDEMELEEKRMFLRSIIEKITYNEGYIKIYLYYFPDFMGIQTALAEESDSGNPVTHACACVTGLPELTFNVEASMGRSLPDKTPGQRIKKARIEKNLSVEELAGAISASLKTIRGWEKDKNKISPRYLKALCHALEVSPEYILGPVPENASPGERIKYHRFCSGCTQREFAEILGINRTTLSDAENDRRSTQYVFQKLIQALN